MPTKGRAVPAPQPESAEAPRPALPFAFDLSRLTLNHIKLLAQLDVLAQAGDEVGAVAHIPALIDMLNALSDGAAGDTPGLQLWPTIGELRKQLAERSAPKN